MWSVTSFSRLKQPQLFTAPLARLFYWTTLLLPQSHLQSHLRSLPLGSTSFMTVSLKNLFPVKSVLRRYPQSFLAHPQLTVWPLFRLLAWAIIIEPQSHRHFHRTCFLPVLEIYGSPCSKTVSLPNLWPVKSWKTPIITAFRNCLILNKRKAVRLTAFRPVGLSVCIKLVYSIGKLSLAIWNVPPTHSGRQCFVRPNVRKPRLNQFRDIP